MKQRSMEKVILKTVNGSWQMLWHHFKWMTTAPSNDYFANA